jgi:hypothetical protein
MGLLRNSINRIGKLVGPEVCEDALHFLNSGHMDSAINATNIALIPKVKTS